MKTRVENQRGQCSVNEFLLSHDDEIAPRKQKKSQSVRLLPPCSIFPCACVFFYIRTQNQQESSLLTHV